MTSNQAFIVTLVTIVGLVVLIALHDLSPDVGVPVIAGLTGVALPTPFPRSEVTQVTRNPEH